MADGTDELDWWDEIDPDSPFNWNFDSVPNDELMACCIWEYARESKTLAIKANLHWCDVRHSLHRREYERDPALKKEHDEEVGRIEEHAKREGFDYDSFCETYWKTDYPFLEIYDTVTRAVGDGARAWQRLPKELRAELARQVDQSIVLRPLTPATVRELEELWRANSAYLAEVRSRIRPKNDDSEDAALWAETEPVVASPGEDSSEREHLTVALTVDFSRFTDREISAAFVAWLKERRPPKWKRPRRVFPGARQKGRKLLEYRVALERLGLMRLLHFHNPTDLREQLPEAWKKIGPKQRDFRREIRAACKFFRKLFPFLPLEEHPDSMERFGIWFPPFGKLTGEMDRERRISRGSK